MENTRDLWKSQKQHQRNLNWNKGDVANEKQGWPEIQNHQEKSIRVTRTIGGSQKVWSMALNLAVIESKSVAKTHMSSQTWMTI